MVIDMNKSRHLLESFYTHEIMSPCPLGGTGRLNFDRKLVEVNQKSLELIGAGTIFRSDQNVVGTIE